MTDKNLPSIEYLHKRLRYDSETGKLFWKDCDEMPKHWRTIHVDGRPRYIGLFATLDEAAEARATAASKNGYTDRHGT
jgi:hypothetical protein